jgi:hypothetical protein
MVQLLGLGLAGLILLAAITWRLFRQTPRLEIGERGIRDPSVSPGWIRWDEIEGVYQRRSQEGDAVFLRLRATERLLRRLRRRAGAPAPGDAFDLRLDLTDTGFSAVEVVQEIMAHASPPSGASRWPGAPSRERG